MANSPTLFMPIVTSRVKSRKIWTDAVVALSAGGATVGRLEVERRLQSLLSKSKSWPIEDKPGLVAAACLVADLLQQGWVFETRRDEVYGSQTYALGADCARAVRREQLALRRDEQLREPATRAFIARMERRQVTSRGRHSVSDLMCDGGLLVRRVHAVRSGDAKNLVEPYIQVAEAGVCCEQTGLGLQDVWRYFRHTWANAYESMPGRSTQFLIRDASQPNHPVIGLLALGSAAIKVRCRDQYIGWEPEAVLENSRHAGFDAMARWAIRLLESKYEEIYKSDLIADGLLRTSRLHGCSGDMVDPLRFDARRARDVHQANVDRSEFAKNDTPGSFEDVDWEKHALTSLFRSKRASRLADLIEIAHGLDCLGADSNPDRVVQALLRSPDAVQAATRLLVLARSETVGTEIADLTVCGALPPYNELLAGKLVAMLATSSDVVRLYRDRYRQSSSIIASSMAGRPVVRPANLVFIGTTSLYGIRPSQYDRISYPTEPIGGKSCEAVGYRYLGQTEGFGSSQISDRTAEMLARFLAQSVGRASRANNVFGEGANPKMRGLREAVEALGFPADRVLRHGQRKCVYGVRLARNVSDYLLRFEDEPDYLFDVERSQSAQAIAKHWQDRWSLPRVSRPEVTARIQAHSTALPVVHGARVVLPKDDEDQLGLFE